MIGKTQQGKSTFVKSMLGGIVEVELGDGRISCTKVLKFYEGRIRGTNKRIIFIDTPGLDDTAGKEADETNLKNLFM